MARREPRRTFSRIRYPGSRATLPCVVHNLSNTGARITAPNVATMPNEFILLLSSRGDRLRDCRAIWRTKFELGVEFVSISPAVKKEKFKRVQMDMSSA